MRRHLGAGTVAIALALSFLSFSPVLAVENIFTEDFETTQYQDTLFTTADWDTAAGELGLFPFTLTLSGTYDTPANAFGVAVSGNHAFVADYTSGLHVIDISDPTNPTLLGNYNTPGGAMGVAVSGDYAFVADYNYGLRVIDISDPTNPTPLGGYYTPDLAYGVAVSGDYAFLADTGSGLLVFEISDPTNPTLLGSYDTPGSANGVAVSGDYALIADGGSGLQVIDISDPANPALLGSYDTPGLAHEVTVSGDHAFVADGGSGLQVIDISDPANPVLLGSYDTAGDAQSVVASGDYAYVADNSPGLKMIDVSDPASPTFLGSYNTSGAAFGVTVSGDHVYLADNTAGLQIIRVSIPLPSPVLLTTGAPPGNWSLGVDVAGDYAFVATQFLGLSVFDISDPESPALVGVCDTPDQARNVTIAGDYAFVADLDSEFHVIDVSDPTNPTPIGVYAAPGRAYDVAIAGDYAFLAEDLRLEVIDISDPANPTLIGTYNTASYVYEVTVAGDYAFLRDDELRIIDISDPTIPTLLGTYESQWGTSGITVQGDYAFAGGSMFQTVDISDPTNPTLVGYSSLPIAAAAVTVAGGYAFVADQTYGLQVIDISDLVNPTIFASCDTPNSASDVTIAGDYAFVADREGGLRVIRVFQHEVYSNDNLGRSLLVDARDDTIFQVRLTTTQTDSIHWELSADGGLNWQGIQPGSNWNRIGVPGGDLLWRSTLSWVAPGDDPLVTDLKLEWLVAAAAIQTIVDVPHDQGGWVSTHFTRSAFDFVDEAEHPISYYAIWRRVDDSAKVAALNSAFLLPPNNHSGTNETEMNGIDAINYQGETYIQSQQKSAASSFPPGVWGLVQNVPALQKDHYVAIIPTVADSSSSGTNRAVFVMTAHTTTPSDWYVSHPDSGYSLDNIAPGAPTAFSAGYLATGVSLDWDDAPEDDFQFHRIYRSMDPGFTPSEENLVHETAAPAWNDDTANPWDFHYKVTTLDHAGNESEAASPAEVTGVQDEIVPVRNALLGAVPNPFNPSTKLSFLIAAAGHVQLKVYDAAGRLVATLVDEQRDAGSHEVIWDGRDNAGRMSSAGVYLYRLETKDYLETKRMTLVK